ncbi:amino acid adenylation domain-containing protein [Micromonospora sp. Llam0]|uniref:non-ribosomal peptide synthetase n=1 Tax=Micromonospora sp. Llam0 TaxID=2485143 RepID=UPI000FB8889F|nr:non-ribosomal peptide synthetase [Micromonospora sp. Llam0]ROO60470.1 amino acid adenylation domain-containing protein [Micromonospora sp. Llam0]
MSPDTLADELSAVLGLPAGTIGDDDNLIELGMDSMATMRLAGAWRRAGIVVRFGDLFARPTLGAWRDLLAASVPRPEPATEPDVAEDEPFPLALMQHAYWVGRTPGQRLGGVAAHFYEEFDGKDIDPARLEQAVRQVLARHGMLRVRVNDDGTQQILPTSPWPGLRIHDLTGCTPEEAEQRLAELRSRLSHRQLDASTGEVFDVRLSLLPSGGTRVHVNLDMIAADALSLRVLMADLATYYTDGTPPPPLGYSYPRYLADRDRHRDDVEADRSYWRLRDLPGAPELPVVTQHARTATRVVRRHRILDSSEFAVLSRRAQQHALTPAMALAAVFAETLTQWSAEPRFLLNLPLFDREPLHPDVASLVGDFTSSVLLAWDGTAGGGFADRARRLQEQFQADAAHTGYSGVEVLRDASRRQGSQMLAPVVYTSALGLGPLFTEEVRQCFGEATWIVSQGPQVLLDAQVTELDGGVLVNWDAREDAFLPGVLDAMFAAYGTLLDRLLGEPQAWSALFSDGRRVVTFEPPADVTHRLHDAFFVRAAQSPQAPALIWARDGWLSYGDLADRVLRMAGTLRARGAGRGDLVAISLPKGPDQIVAALAVLAAGAAYLPVGVDQPPARRERILSGAGTTLLIDESFEVTGPPLTTPVDGEPGDLAYVLYTSGSTGEPKGVEVTHAAAQNTVADLSDRFGLGPGDRTLAVSALEFDLSVFDMFATLGSGGSLVCVDQRDRRDATAWAELVRRHEVTVLNCVPPLLDALLTALDGNAVPLRVVLLGGDRVTVDLPGRLAAVAPQCRFVAAGGTTETAIHSTICEVTDVPADWALVPYGVPLRGVRCRVVDPLGRDCPDWVTGELWIGGAGVARGYRGDPTRTSERFVIHDGVRWYRTGDRARYRPGAVIEFLGRTDHQVKIRGYRVELGEVEAALSSHPQVTGSVVVRTADGRLGAAVTGTADPDSVSKTLATLLPEPMRPDLIVHVAELPLTRNGKIDRSAAAGLLDGYVVDRRPATPPRGLVEQRVAEAWRDVLGADPVGREDDFFALGGDSLLATKLLGRLRSAGFTGVALSALFAHPVLADFAETLRVGSEPAVRQITADPAAAHEPFPPTDVQRAYWLGRSPEFTLGGVGCHFYREFDTPTIDVARLEAAANRLVQRHPMLRAVFADNGVQRVLPHVPQFRVRVLPDVREAMAHRVFDPSVWPLFDIGVEQTPTGARIGLGIDTLVADALSILMIYSELSALYADLGAALPPVELTFRDYLLGSRPSPAALRKATDYWRSRLDTLPPAPQLPLAVDPATTGVPRFTRRSSSIGPSDWQRLRDRAREHGVTPSALLLTAYAEILGRWSARTDLTLNLTLFDRDGHPHVDRVVGDFTSLVLVAYQPETGDSWLDRVRRVQRDLWQGLDHRELSAVGVLRELARHTGDGAVTMPVVFTSALGVPGEAASSGLFAEPVWGLSQTPQVWLDHQVVERHDPDGLGVDLYWDAVEGLFPPGVLDDMFGAYLALVTALADSPWDAPAPTALPSDQVRQRQLVNATAAPERERTLHLPFFAMARDDPDEPAVVDHTGAVLTRGQLADKALRVAALLRAKGVSPAEPVAVSLPKGPDQIVAVLGVLAAGAAYVPVGVDQPPARRDRTLATADARIVLTGATLQEARRFEPLPTPAPADPEALAYLIFTSGSTGEPRGVEITHRAAANTVEDINDRYGVGPEDRVLAVSALDFDLSVYDIFGLLGAGGAVVTIGEEHRRDAQAWHRIASEHGVTVWNSVPTLLEMLLVVGDVGSLRLALVSGDWVGLDLRVPGARLVALGGATEASIWSNAFDVADLDPEWPSVPYGYPLRNQRFRVVDGLGRDCPDWVPGELWIGGAGVARRYRDAPELTSARFVVADGERWYRTGDLGRYRPGAILEFLGRADHQVKLRGHRIELGEIEAALCAHPAIASAVAVFTGSAITAAAVPAADTVDEDALVRWVVDRLPAHMVPARIAVIEALPLSANGKIDRRRIAELSADTRPDQATAPEGPLEVALAETWSTLLNQPTIGRDDNFFTLGGDSLAATRIIEQIRRAGLGEVTLAVFFSAATIRRVAAHLAAVGPYESGEI